MITHRRTTRPRGFTLLEMVVVLVVLGVVSTFAVSTYRQTTTKIADRGATRTLNQLAEDAQGLAEATEAGVITRDILQEAVDGLPSDLLAAGPGLQAAGAFTLVDEGDPSQEFGEIATDVDDGEAATEARVTMMSKSGNCATARFAVDGFPELTVAEGDGTACAATGSGQGGGASVPSTPTLTCSPLPGAVGLSWSFPSGEQVDSFEISQDGSPTESASGAVREMTISGLEPDSSYEFSITAYDPLGRPSAGAAGSTCSATPAQP